MGSSCIFYYFKVSVSSTRGLKCTIGLPMESTLLQLVAFGLAAAAANILGGLLLFPAKFRAEYRWLLRYLLALGAGFMLAVDTMCRIAFPTEIPPGVATAFIGTPVFIALLALTFRRSA